MRTLVVTLLLGAIAAPADAQYRGPRSGDYLFSATVWGARAAWVNPAGLGALRGASIMGEALVERDAAGGYGLAQYTLGFSSRVLGFGYRRDRFPGDVAGNTWRLGLGRALGRFALGAAVSLYSESDLQQGLDFGAQYHLAPGLALGVVVQNIGQPEVRDSVLRLAGAAGISWTGLGGVLGLDGEMHGTDQVGRSGLLLASRLGLRLAPRLRVPVAVATVLEFGDSFDVTRLLVGLSVGADYQVTAVAAGSRLPGKDVISGVSLVAQASKQFP